MKTFILSAAVLGAACLSAEQHAEGWRPDPGDPMTLSGDRVVFDNVTKAACASGHVCAVRAPITLRSDWLERDVDGVMRFHAPTCVTTCSNEVGHTHWNVTGDIAYKANDFVIVRDAWLRMYEIPLVYLPYLWYPLNWDCGFEWMPGYAGRWGAFLLTKYSYHIAGDPHHEENTYWLKGSTLFDLRSKNGIALGEDLKWNLGDFGKGNFRVYYAWDENADDRYTKRRERGDPKYSHWGSEVDYERYGLTLEHCWYASERDTVFVRGSFYSDSYFQQDFLRRSVFDIKSRMQYYTNSGVFWEHLESAFSFGAEVSGRLNDFYGMTDRLPEIYLDVNPQPVFSLPVNYESQNRLGKLSRHYAKYSGDRFSIFASNPGIWADYDAFRFDTYHRLTAPFKICDDVLSVVPRLGYHGTCWDESGFTDIYGAGFSRFDAAGRRREGDAIFRSIGEAGVTFAARGSGWVNDTTSHMIEPYLDVLVQEAWYSGRKGGDFGNRPYIFDNIDASMAWEDQFAGRGRNLPYSYRGVTPGLRNAWSVLDEKGRLNQILDFDVYAAVMFGETDFVGNRAYGDYKSHKLAKLGRPNYGEDGVTVMPGARLRWTPSNDIGLGARAEYDTDRDRVALAALNFRQTVTRDFSYGAEYGLRDHRYWDFSSTPYSPNEVTKDSVNMVQSHYLFLRCTYQPVDWLAFSPFVRWDFREGELDCVGSWIDYLTDCLGFRLSVEYNNDYDRIDGYRHKQDWNISFMIYLRAFGPGGMGLY